MEERWRFVKNENRVGNLEGLVGGGGWGEASGGLERRSVVLVMGVDGGKDWGEISLD